MVYTSSMSKVFSFSSNLDTFVKDVPMIRSNPYIGVKRRIVRYTEEEWSSSDFRIQALSAARDEARVINGEIIIKVKYGRGLTTMARIRYVGARNGFSNYYRPNRPR